LRKQGFFPEPQLDADTGRAFYDEDAQFVCLEVRRRNCGINGKTILFYARRADIGAARKPSKESRQKSSKVAGIYIDRLKGLGLSSVTAAQVEAAISELYPSGINGRSETEVVKAIFLHQKSKEKHD
jgi:hypothetical protein